MIPERDAQARGVLAATTTPPRRLAVRTLVALLFIACDPTSASKDDTPVGHTTSLVDATATPSATYQAASAQASRTVASVEGVGAARDAARLALSLHAERPGGGYLERARSHLREASRRRLLPGACEAGLELARLEASVAGSAQSAYVEAYRTAVRFGRNGQHASCVASARWMLGVLDAYRADASLLAPIDADPDAGDPSVEIGSSLAASGPVAGAAHVTDMDVYAFDPDGQAGLVGTSSARVVLRLDGPPLFRRGEAPPEAGAHRRAFLEFENVSFAEAIPRTRAVDAGGLSGLRIEDKGAGSTLNFELAAEARYRLFSMTDPHRLVVDVQRAAPTASADKRGPLIVLDPGHGANDYGARGHNGLTEAELTLDIARRVRSWIKRLVPDARVRMTRDSDVFISLEERAAMANALGASLFISIHLNASSQPIDRGGVATFVLDVNNNRNVLRLAARENGTATRAVTELQFLVGSLARAEQARESRRAAKLIQHGTLFAGRRFLPKLNDRGVRSAMFYVLVGAQMPAVLVECSFLTQRDEAEQLARARYREGLAEGLARGAVEYLRAPR